LILALSMLSYFLADMTTLAGIQMSGIISLLTCGIIQSHYTYYNLSPQGKITSTLTISFLGTAAEAGIYSYIGLSLYSNLNGWWSWGFIIYETIIVVVGRFAAIFGCFYTFNMCFKSRTINARELVFIGWGGMIRGAIAFALVLRIPKQGEPSCESADPMKDCYSTQNFDLMVTTTFVLIVFTTLVFGSFMALMGRILVPPKKVEVEEMKFDDPNFSHHHLIEHPNEVPDLDDSMSKHSNSGVEPKPPQHYVWKRSALVNWYVEFDKSFLRPFFVRKKGDLVSKDDIDDNFKEMKTLAQSRKSSSSDDSDESRSSKRSKASKASKLSKKSTQSVK